MINLLSPFLGHTEVLCGESGTLGSKTPSNKPAKLVTIYQQEVQKCLRKLTGIEGGECMIPAIAQLLQIAPAIWEDVSPNMA